MTSTDFRTLRKMLAYATKGGVLEQVKEHYRMYRVNGYKVSKAAYMALYDWDCETILEDSDV